MKERSNWRKWGFRQAAAALLTLALLLSVCGPALTAAATEDGTNYTEMTDENYDQGGSQSEEDPGEEESEEPSSEEEKEEAESEEETDDNAEAEEEAESEEEAVEGAESEEEAEEETESDEETDDEEGAVPSEETAEENKVENIITLNESESITVYLYVKVVAADGEDIDVTAWADSVGLKFNNATAGIWCTVGKIEVPLSIFGSGASDVTSNASTTKYVYGDTYCEAVKTYVESNYSNIDLYSANKEAVAALKDDIEWDTFLTENGANDYVDAGTAAYHLNGILTLTNYALTYDANTEDTVTGMPDPLTETSVGPSGGYTFTVSDSTPTREGYTFAGWCREEGGGDIFKDGDQITVTGTDTVLYAQWYPNYTLIYDANGGTGAPASETQASGTGWATFIVSDTEPTREGYTFLGWADTADATYGIYSEGIRMLLTYPATEKTLYAVWRWNTVWEGLTIEKTTDKVIVNPGDTVNYTITVTNNTGNDLPRVDVSDILDSRLTYVSATGTGIYNANGLWATGGIANGDSAQLTITATVNDDVPNGTEIPNTARVIRIWDDIEDEPAEGYEYPSNTVTVKVVVDTVTLTIQKVWKDNNDSASKRPDSVRVQLYCDGVANEIVLLQAKYGWKVELPVEAGHTWTMEELDVPSGYKASYSSSNDGNTLTVTNKLKTTYTSSGTLLQTGQLNWPIPVLMLLGLATMGAGVLLLTEKRKGKYQR